MAFNETFSFNSQDNELKVYVMEDDTFVDDNLGTGVLHVGQYRQQPYPQDGKFPSDSVEVICTQDNKPTCKVYLKVMGGQGGQGGMYA